MKDWKSALAALGATEEYNDNNKTDNECKALGSLEQNNASIDSTEKIEARLKAKKRVGVVYSTNHDYEYAYDSQQEIDTLPKNQQKLRLNTERAGRSGKTVTLVKGFIGSEEDITALCKLLKQKCGVGGSIKNGEVIIQGDHRQRLIEILKNEGFCQAK